MSDSNAPRRIAELDGLRAIAILSVFIHHALGVPLLWMGVDLFFVLSGFLITGILLGRKSSGGAYFRYFYQRRARRILLPYAILLGVSSLLFGVAWTRHWYWFAFFGTNFAAALRQITPNYEPSSLMPLWSLAVEEQFYLLWPFVILAASRRSLVRIAAAGIVVAPVLRALCTPLFKTSYPIYFLTPFRMDLLFAGALFAVLWKDSPSLVKRLRTPAWGMLVAAPLLLLVLSRNPHFRTHSNTVLSNTVLYSLGLTIAASLLVIALSGTGRFCGMLRWRALGFVGTISYSMYLIHMSAILLAKNAFPSRTAAFCVSLAATVLYATVSWHAIEKRLLHPGKSSAKSSTRLTALRPAADPIQALAASESGS